MTQYKYKHAILGGTFDHLHQGHKKFLNKAYQKAQYIYCGLVKKTKNKALNNLIEPYTLRQKNLKKFLKQNNYWHRTRLFPIKNPLGPYFTNQSLQAIFATQNTFSGAKYLNRQRQILNLPSLKIEKIPLHKNVSSTKIRMGKANKKGINHLNLFKNTLLLPEKQRKHFKKPMGKLLSGSDHSLRWSALQAKKIIKKNNPLLIITVGDITTHSFIKNNLPFNIAVLDFKHRREKISAHLHQPLFSLKANKLHTQNPSGTITKDLIQTIIVAINKSLKGKKQIITLLGEEDLSVLPLILLSPLKTFVFYGQPGKGLVAVKVDLKTKNKAQNLLLKFKPLRFSGKE